MPFVTVKKKYQVVIPAAVRRQIGIRVGDLLEARAERGRITLKPKSIIDRRIAEGLEDIKHGRFIGPFTNAKEAMEALRAIAKK